MNASSDTPIRDGFGSVTRPLLLAELSWRWLFGVAALLLIVMASFQLLASIEIDRSQAMLLHGRNPWLIAEVLGGVALPLAARVVRVTAVLLPALTLLWIVATGVGRTVVLRRLLGLPRVRFSSQLGIAFLQAMLGWLTLLGYGGMLLLWGRAMAVENGLSRGASGLGFFLSTLLVAYFYSLASSLLTAAPIFAARDRFKTFGAVSASAALFRSHTGRCFRIGVWFCLFRVAVLAGAGIVWLLTLALSVHAPVAGLLAAAIVAIVYCVLTDYLLLARLAAYAAIAEPPPQTLTGTALPVAVPS